MKKGAYETYRSTMEALQRQTVDSINNWDAVNQDVLVLTFLQFTHRPVDEESYIDMFGYIDAIYRQAFLMLCKLINLPSEAYYNCLSQMGDVTVQFHDILSGNDEVSEYLLPLNKGEQPKEGEIPERMSIAGFLLFSDMTLVPMIQTVWRIPGTDDFSSAENFDADGNYTLPETPMTTVEVEVTPFAGHNKLLDKENVIVAPSSRTLH